MVRDVPVNVGLVQSVDRDQQHVLDGALVSVPVIIAAAHTAAVVPRASAAGRPIATELVASAATTTSLERPRMSHLLVGLDPGFTDPHPNPGYLRVNTSAHAVHTSKPVKKDVKSVSSPCRASWAIARRESCSVAVRWCMEPRSFVRVFRLAWLCLFTERPRVVADGFSRPGADRRRRRSRAVWLARGRGRCF